MNITHTHIKHAQKQLSEKFSAREDELKEVAQKIYDDFVESLELPSTYWFDNNGTQRPYVTTGLKNENGMYQARPIVGFQLDNDYKLNFLISTVIDDSRGSGGPHYLVSVSISKSAGVINVDVGAGKKHLAVSDSDANGAFYAVSNAIKDVIISGFTDPRLD